MLKTLARTRIRDENSVITQIKVTHDLCENAPGFWSKASKYSCNSVQNTAYYT